MEDNLASGAQREPELLGQTVVVIGGSAGIGFETARRARAEGAKVILTARNPERLQRAATEVDALSTAAFDVTEFKLLGRFFEGPALAADPTGPFPPSCANFDQLGFRVPFLAISPFSKPHYVSHSAGDHTSLLALIEKVFMTTDNDSDDQRPHLTRRDQHANPLEDMFDFDRSPSFSTAVGTAAPPAQDCTPR